MRSTFSSKTQIDCGADNVGGVLQNFIPDMMKRQREHAFKRVDHALLLTFASRDDGACTDSQPIREHFG